MTLGDKYPIVPVNAVVKNIKDLESVPMRTGVYPTVFLRDVGDGGGCLRHRHQLRAGERPAHGLHPGHQARGCLHALRRRIWSRQNLPKFQSVVPDDVKVSYEFDQSPYVTRAIAGLTMEGALGAVLTGLMVLAVPARLAQRVDRRDQYSACRCWPQSLALVDHRADHQHHDARRAGARRRHSGG